LRRLHLPRGRTTARHPGRHRQVAVEVGADTAAHDAGRATPGGLAMSDAMFDDERDEALALLWLDEDTDDADLGGRAVETWAPAVAGPPPDLFARVTDAARAVRRPGTAAGPTPPVVEPIDAYRRTADQLAGLLATLDDAA